MQCIETESGTIDRIDATKDRLLVHDPIAKDRKVFQPGFEQ